MHANMHAYKNVNYLISTTYKTRIELCAIPACYKK